MTTTTISSNPKASLPLRGLHWLMAFLIISAWVLIYAKGLFAKGSVEREFLKQAHMFSGLVVFGLLPLRAAVRWLSLLPPISPSPGRWTMLLAQTAHASLYACMIALPILGVLFVEANGKTIGMAGFSLPTLIHTDKALSHVIKEIHETLGLAMLCLTVAHAGAALWHHVFRHDNTLRRML